MNKAFGNAFELPDGVQHGKPASFFDQSHTLIGVHATWSRTYQHFQQFSFYCTAASLLLTLMGVHEVRWAADNPFTELFQ